MLEGPGDVPFASASDLAEYAYCPRAWWYRDHPPIEPPDRSTARRLHAGVTFHAIELAADRRRESRGGYRAFLGVVLGLAVLAILLIFGVP